MYSKDLIIRVITYYKNNDTTLNQTAKIFNVSISSVKRWLNNQIPLGTRNKKITNYYNDVQNIIDNKPYTTIKENQNEINNKLSIGSIFNIIKQINYSNKKIKYKHFYNNKQNKDDKINDFIKKNKDINDYISIDETYFNCYINPLNGYSKKGTKI